jgi:hypothetical protein
MFELKEFVLVHHALVDYFMMHSGKLNQPLKETIVVTVVEPQAQAQDVSDTAATRDSPETSVGLEFSCYVTEPHKQRDSNKWIGDSGASCHMTCSDKGMFNCRIIKSSVKVGNGKELPATKIGDKRMTVVQKVGSATDVLLKDCKYVPQLFPNIFSIMKAL